MDEPALIIHYQLKSIVYTPCVLHSLGFVEGTVSAIQHYSVIQNEYYNTTVEYTIVLCDLPTDLPFFLRPFATTDLFTVSSFVFYRVSYSCIFTVC
jgi:hypothetical protein